MPGGVATLSWAYMSKGAGTIVGTDAVAFIGTIYFDGEGGLVNPFTASVAGTILRGEGQATYTVNGDCTGIANDHGAKWAIIQTYDLRVSPDGSKVDYIETDAGTVANGTASSVGN